MSETINESENFALPNWAEENQEQFLLSSLIESINMLKDSSWWVSILPIEAKDGTILARFTIAPPEGFVLNIVEDGETTRVSVKKE